MKKWTLRVLYALLVLLPVAAIADYTATQGSGTTIFTFTCFSTKLCPAHTMINSAGTEIMTAANPGQTGAPAGGYVDGWDATQGAKADAACGTATGTCSIAALIKFLNSTASSATPAGTNTIGNVNGAPNVTATDCSGTITSGGTAQNAIAAQTTLHGFTIANVDSAHNDEVLWISFTTTAAAQTAQSYPLPPPAATTFAGFGSFTTPTGFGLNHAVSIIGATTGHVFSCSWW